MPEIKIPIRPKYGWKYNQQKLQQRQLHERLTVYAIGATILAVLILISIKQT